MVSVSVRRNRREPVGRNAQSDDPRHNRAYPHPANPGLFEHVDGWYDWAGRRLFLADGSPDPMTPGAYRYQTRPDLTDLDAPDSDPWSPRYEPPHLRHRPGDTWIIDRDRPHDPDDPGVFGSPGWRPDRRTGRHRRNELPDPIPPWEAPEDTEEAAEADQAETEPERRPKHGSGNSSEVPQYPASSGRSTPRRRPRFWQEEHEDRAGGETAQEEPWHFEKLREDAWDRFVIKSSELAAAHWVDRQALDAQHRRPVAAVLQMIRWIIAPFKTRNERMAIAPAPSAQRSQSQSQSPVRLPRQAGPQADCAPEPVPIVLPQARPMPGAQMAQAIRSVQAARIRLSATARDTREPQPGPTESAAHQAETHREAKAPQPDRGTTQPTGTSSGSAAQSDREAQGAEHWRDRPRQERSRPSPLPYITRWEQMFDAHRAFGEVAVP